MGAVFIKHISAEALGSAAVGHPYLRAMRAGDFSNIALAFKDFTYQYDIYRAGFTRYVSAAIDNLSDAGHKQTLMAN